MQVSAVARPLLQAERAAFPLLLMAAMFPLRTHEGGEGAHILAAAHVPVSHWCPGKAHSLLGSSLASGAPRAAC